MKLGKNQIDSKIYSEDHDSFPTTFELSKNHYLSLTTMFVLFIFAELRNFEIQHFDEFLFRFFSSLDDRKIGTEEFEHFEKY